MSTQQTNPSPPLSFQINTPLGALILSNPAHWELFRRAMDAAKADDAPANLLPHYIQLELRESFSLFPLANAIVSAIEDTTHDASIVHKPLVGWSNIDLDDLAAMVSHPPEHVKVLRAGLVIIGTLEAKAINETTVYFRLAQDIKTCRLEHPLDL